MKVTVDAELVIGKTKSGVTFFYFYLGVDLPTFQFNLAVIFQIKQLLDVHGSTDIAFSWSPQPPDGWWHVFLGEKTPEERRCGGELLSFLSGYSYFQLWRDRMLVGAGIGIKKDWNYGPVHVWVNASLDGEAEVGYVRVKPDDASVPADSPPPEPQRAIQFDAFLEMLGDAGLNVFGVGLEITLNADAKAKGPTPWYLSMKVHLGIKINLLIKTFEWSADLPLTWGDENLPQPLPVLPIVEFVSAEKPGASGRGDDR